MNSKESPVRFTLFLVVLLLLPTQLVHTQEISTFDYDLNSQRVTYYPESLMLSRTPKAITFYQDTKLLKLFIDLRTPETGHDFTINNTCDSDVSFSRAAVRAIANSAEIHAANHVFTQLYFFN